MLIPVAHFVLADGKQPLLDGIAACLWPGVLLTADLMAKVDARERLAHKRATMRMRLTDDASDAVLRGAGRTSIHLTSWGFARWGASGFSAPTAYFRSPGLGALASIYGGGAAAPALHRANDGRT